MSQAFDSAKSEVRQMVKAAKYPQARIFATQLLKKYGQDAELLYLRGTACAHRDVAEQAENDLRAAIALKPERVDFYITLSNFLFGQKRYESAFHEFIRARKLAPKHPKILAYAKIFGGVDGKLDKQLDQTMKAFQEKRVDRALADELVELYFIKAMLGWNVSCYDSQFVFFASHKNQISITEHFLRKIVSLRVLGEKSKKRQQHLQALIKVNCQRRFDGIAFDWILASLIFVIGIFVSGFFGLLYALSAVGVIWAYQSPNYLFNQTVPKYTNNLKGSVKSFLDFIYGVRLSSSLWVLNGIHNEKMREEIAFILRSLLRATFLPVSVFAGLSRNYSRKFAIGFSSISMILAFLLVFHYLK